MSKRKFVCVAMLFMLCVACRPDGGQRRDEPWKKPEPSSSFYPVSLTELKVVTHQVIYVPVYSHIALPGAEQRTLYLSATLSIRNTDPHQRIILTAVEYYDSNGALVEAYLPGSFALAPMATTEVLVPQLDTRGGSGANFLVKWSAETTVSAPIIEAVMAGIMGNSSFAFARRGRVIQPLPNTSMETDKRSKDKAASLSFLENPCGGSPRTQSVVSYGAD
jgi:hypothetical protein